MSVTITGPMTQAADPILISVPRAVLSDLAELPAQLNDRMHDLLERNTDGALAPHEQAELTTLVRVAELGQIAAMALHPQGKP